MKNINFIIIALTLLLAMQLAPHQRLYSQQYTFERHTPGFPYNISSETISKFLESMYKALGNISTGSMGLGKENVSQSLYNISKQISDEKLRRELINIANSYAANSSIDRKALLKAIELATNSNASLSDVVQFLNAIRGLAQAEGYKDIVTVSENALARLIEKLANSSMLQNQKGFVEQVPQKIVEALPRLLQMPGSIPSLGMTPPQMVVPTAQMPSIFLSIDTRTAILLLGIVIVATLVIVFRSAIANNFKAMLTRRGVIGARERYAKTFAQGVRKAIANYWRAVEFVEKVYMAKKEDWMTHREYLALASTSLKEHKNVFERITQLYEAARFAHDQREEIDEESEKFLNILIGDEK